MDDEIDTVSWMNPNKENSPVLVRVGKRPDTENDQVNRRYNRQQSIQKRIFTFPGGYLAKTDRYVKKQGRREGKLPGCHDRILHVIEC